MRHGSRILAAGAAFALSCASAPAADRVKVTYPTLSMSYIFFFAAIDKGYYRDEMLDLDVVEAGGGVATPALVSGDAQFSTSGSSAISAIMRGAKLKVLVVGEDRPSWQLWATRPEIKSIDDLKGLQVGVVSRGDTGEVAVRYMLKAKGLPPDFVSFTPMGSSLSARMAVVRTGTLPAGLLQPAEVEALRATGGLGRAHLVADAREEVRSIFNGLATSDAMIKSRPDVVLRFVRATRKGMIFARSLKEAAIDVFVRTMKGSREGASLGYDLIRRVMAEDGTIPASAQATEIALRADMLGMAMDKAPPPAAVFDFSFVQQVNAELKASGWVPKR